MASYTMQLRTYIERWTQYEPDLSISERIEEGRQHLFDFEYPFFDEEYRKVFETNFIRHFYTREIGFETEELFKFRLETWLNINMPYFNKMFESELLEFDPLSNTDMNVERTKQTDSNQHSRSNTQSTGNSTSKGFSRDIDSDTPDGRLSLTSEDGEGVIEYASKIGESMGNNEASGETNTNDEVTADINTVEDYVSHRFGKIGVQSFSKLLQEYRDTLLRIERQIFDEMNELFMLIY